jgi:hypothetical protein
MQWRRHVVAAAAFGALALLAASAAADEAPRFDLPVACPADVGCIVRNFVDDDPGPDAKDWHCGRLTYDGHKGTDIRVPDGVAMARGIPVLAAASGTVLRLRDGMADVSIRVTGADAVKDREAGNSLIIDHGNGWETQYGHLRKGSIIVKRGQTVTAGQPIALMGLSGNTEFTHTHFEVRHNGKPVDPYNGADMGTDCGARGTALWTARALTALAYHEDAPFDAGFADARPDEWAARAGAYADLGLTVDSPALVFWIDVIGHRAGDRQSIRLIGPDGAVLTSAADTIKEAHIQWFQFIGKKRPSSGWPAGRYRGEYSLTREVDGQPQTVIAIKREIELR